ncbi:MAG: T9SS type A sorting domain-containing protein [Bacteroidia bacterium]
MKKILLFLFCLASISLFSQCPTLTVAPLSYSANCPGPFYTFTATPSYSANVTSRWLGNVNLPMTSTVITSLNSYKDVFMPSAPGTYTIEFTDNSTSCVVTQTVNVLSGSGFPTYDLVASTYSQTCSNSVVTFSVLNVTTTASLAPTSYYFGQIMSGYNLTPFSNSLTLPVGSCGNYRMVVHDNVNSCETIYDFVLSCATLSASPLTFAGNNTICIGSSATLSVTGANTYTWLNTSSNSQTINVSPTSPTNYSVNATNSLGCITNSTYVVVVNPTCAEIWPGDANSDGIVDNTDVFELGLWNLNTGPTRTLATNNYTGQIASNWTGTVSSGKNQNHADCNGDGTIDTNDTLAIFNNFSQTHAFKAPDIFVTNADISIVPTQTLLLANTLSSADIYLGSAIQPLTNLYGVSFNIQFDSSLVQNNSIYISYNNSFFNTGNINFKKTLFANEKVYTASIRTNGTNVSGNGKIATLYFKTKSNFPGNSVLNLSVVNPKVINNTGAPGVITAGTSSLQVLNDVGFNENSKLQNMVIIYPNPAKEFLYINNNLKETITIEMTDVFGRPLLKTSVTASDKTDLKGLSTGVYFITVRSNTNSFERKIIVE